MALERQSNLDSEARPTPVITDRDIVFNCPSCHGELVVDLEGAGMDCLCAHCGFALVIPQPSSAFQPAAELPPLVDLLPAAPTPPSVEKAPARSRFGFEAMEADQITRRVEELKHQLKENMSQHTEMRGHVNRATIELHRLQLRLKTLQDRRADIEAELAEAKSSLDSNAA